MSLSIVIGSMFSGKSTELLETINCCKQNQQSYIAINHSFDIRYGNNKIINHNQKSEESLMLNKISDLELKKLENIDYLLIDEAHFFEDLYNSINKCIKNYPCLNIKLVGLDGDFQQKVFNNGQLLKLIPLADEVKKLYSQCYNCSNKAPFTKRFTKSKQQVLVSSKEDYQPSCRKCLKL